ncbi:MAG: hypothetical protein JSW61_00945 [Candidatus Thorarchaeota archaeon]|nr:MAG: hypothetical protein JSW61_00945 [Candidatus Thorarchaeota archaeon]
MRALEAKIREGLRIAGIDCQSVYQIPNEDAPRVLLAFGSSSKHLTPRRVKKVLDSLGIGQFNVPNEFQRLSAAFLHLEVVMGAKTEQTVVSSAL